MKKSKKISKMVERRLKTTPTSNGKFKYHAPGSQNLHKS